ncbi:hypothetical protein GQ457_18G006120 [Hibiscus cannabinus]
MRVEQTMRALAVALACWAITVEPLKQQQHPLIKKVTFNVTGATQSSYDLFIENLRTALTAHGNEVLGIPMLPSSEDMPDNDLRRYVIVELSAKDTNGEVQRVSFVIDTTNTRTGKNVLLLSKYHPRCTESFIPGHHITGSSFR